MRERLRDQKAKRSALNMLQHSVVVVVVVLVLISFAGEAKGSLVFFSSQSGVTKPQKAKHPSTCAENMVEVTNKAFKHAMKKDVFESKIPSSVEAFQRLNFSTCAVVGNGGTLKTTKFGKSIDSHEVVFRANQAPIKGYEDKVGAKTTFRILNKRWLGTYSANVGYLPLEKGVFLTTSRGDQKVIDTLYRKHKDNPKVNVITMSSKISGASRKVLEEFKDFVKCKKRGKSFHGGSTISSGLYETFMALALCDKVTVYGFGNGGHGLYQYYVFRNTERRRGDSVHSFDAEKALILQLERDGFLKTCFGKSKEGNDCGNQHHKEEKGKKKSGGGEEHGQKGDESQFIEHDDDDDHDDSVLEHSQHHSGEHEAYHDEDVAHHHRHDDQGEEEEEFEEIGIAEGVTHS